MPARTMISRAVVATLTIAMMAFAHATPANAAPPHNITIADATITEGDAGSANLSFTISVGGPAAAGITVDYATADVTALAGSDYSTATGTAALENGGCKCAIVDVPILGDTTPELEETLAVDLSNAVNGTITDAQAIGTITDADEPHATVDDPSLSESGGTMQFTVTLDQVGVVDSVIGYATAAGTGTEGSDYVGATGTLTILAGDAAGTVDVTVLDDSVYEGDEDFTVDLAAVSGVVLDDTQALGTISEDDPMPAITVDDPTVAEGGASMTFVLSLDTAADVDVTVGYATSDNTATDGSDYTGSTGTATILAGDTSTTVDVAIADDAVYEGDETLNLDLSGEVNGALADAQGQGTITDDDPMPTIDVDSPSAGEADTSMTFTISLDVAAAVDVSVDYATADGSALDAEDYTGASGSATVVAGNTSTTVDVAILDDGVYEGDEDFSLGLSNEVNGMLGTASGTATITDDDAAPGVAIADNGVTEGDGGTSTLDLSVSLTGVSAFDVSVDYATADGTATAGSDYVADSGTVTILAGATTGLVQVVVNGDTTYEANEDFTITLSNLVGPGTIDTATATGTITNDDKQVSSLTVKTGKTTTKVQARGLLEPASTGNKVTVTLSRYRNGTWVTVSSKSVSAKKLSDRDSDGLTDAKYKAAFPRPVAGRYRFTAAFAGDADTLAKTTKVEFTL